MYMGNFRYKMAQFMSGRNGFDNFCQGLIALALVLIIADLFIPGRILNSAVLLIFIYVYFRAFSRNIERRRAENQWFTTYIGMPLRSYLARDRKNYKYFKCPGCGQVLRAPKGRGKIRITCSRCNNIFDKKV